MNVTSYILYLTFFKKHFSPPAVKAHAPIDIFSKTVIKSKSNNPQMINGSNLEKSK